MTVTTAQVTVLLENTLFESPVVAQANTAYWVTISQTDPAASTVSGLAVAMTQSPEAGIAEQVARYYEGALGRVPSAAEISFYVQYAETGLSGAQIAQGAGAVPVAVWGQIAGFFTASPEYVSLMAGGKDIPSLYENILGRTPSAGEVAYYQHLLDGGTPVSALLQYFVNSPEYQAKANAAIATQLANDGVVAVEHIGIAVPGPIPVSVPGPAPIVGESSVDLVGVSVTHIPIHPA